MRQRLSALLASIYPHAPKESRQVGCTATARNADGSLSMSSDFVRLKK